VLAGVLVVSVAAILSAWSAGGLRTRPHGVPMVRPGGTVDQGVFAVQVLDARAGHMKIHSFDPVKNLLVVRMRVTDKGDRS
jgi:hypothetical protein